LGSKEAWSFAYAKAPKVHASEGSRNERVYGECPTQVLILMENPGFIIALLHKNDF
jgi:hypothetical protein